LRYLICLAITFLNGYVTLRPAVADEPESPFGDDAQVNREIEEILAGPDFRRLRARAPEVPEIPEPPKVEVPEWMKKFFEWLFGAGSAGASAASGLGSLIVAISWGVVAAICCFIIWLVVKAVNNYRARHSIDGPRRTYEEGEAEIPPGDLPADEYLRRAAELAANGHYREAIGQLILGAMSFTERGGLIRFRRGLTHRDYLRALRGRAPQHQAFRTIVAVYEPICFGRRAAETNHYQTSLDGYETGFRQPILSESNRQSAT
jgi:hypothetical protein